MIRIFIRREGAHLPSRATAESVGYDLYAWAISESGRPNKLLIPPRNVRAIPTGITVLPPAGYSFLVASRSGMAKERAIFVANSPGVVDPDYRGEIMVLLYNGGHETQYIQHGDRVGQLILIPWKPFDMEVISKLDETPRGEGGFGSTGR